MLSIMTKILNSKLVIMGEYQNAKIFLERTTHQIGLGVFAIKKQKILYNEHVISDLNGEEIVGTFYEKEMHKTRKK